jgi:hypothetical protein
MTVYRAPITPGMRWVDGAGAPLAGFLLFQYLAGGLTLADTYTSASGLVKNANPIILDADGGLDAPNIDIWLSGGVAYKLVVTDASAFPAPGVQVWSKDDLQGDNDPAFAAVTVGAWLSGPGLTWVSSVATGTAASAVGDQTPALTPGRRVRVTDAGGDHYGTVGAASYAPNITSLTLVMDGGTVIVNPITDFAYALEAADSPSVPTSPAPAFTLPDGAATIIRGFPRSIHQTPTTTANGTLKLNDSFLSGDRLRFFCDAAAQWMQLQGADASAICPVLPGMSVELECISDNPADSTGWKNGRPQGENALNYLSVAGTSGVDNTAQFVKQITIPAYLLDSMQGVIVVGEFAATGAINWSLYLGTAGTTGDTQLGTISSGGVGSLGFVLRLKKINSTNVAYALLGALAAASGRSGVATTNIDTTADMILGVYQAAAVGVHITVHELILAL